ncbi:MAG: iron-sulfur protein, putative nitrous oxide reductase [Halonotius sp. J07HN4]|nr:MAG: iron-sulfur protein, putative nitrous oxide reductase [Halonotius sp. J07HN4]
MPEHPNSRRRFLRVAGAAAITTGLAGCGDSGTETAESTSGDTNDETSADTDGADGVPPSERTAEALNGIERNPDALQDPDALSYQPTPNNGQRCDGCQYYVPDQNGDGMGACTLISGQVDPEGWCFSYAVYDE